MEDVVDKISAEAQEYKIDEAMPVEVVDNDIGWLVQYFQQNGIPTKDS